MNTCATPILSSFLLLGPSMNEDAVRAAPKAADVFRQARCGFAVLDADLRITGSNAGLQRLLGLDADTLPGRQIGALDDGNPAVATAAIRAALLESSLWKGVITATQPVGAQRELEWIISSQSDTDMLFAVVTDVTERVRAQREAERALVRERAARARIERANQLKDDFIAEAVHELRHPLAPMQNAVYLLQHAGADSVVTDKVRSVLDRQLRQMIGLVDDLMDVARLGRGVVELDRKCMSLDAAVRGALETSQPHILAADQRLHVEFAGADLRVFIDPARFGQVLVNVLNNASKYTPRGGRIEVIVSGQQSTAQVAINDSGVGIPPDRLDDIFGLFTQMHPSSDRSSGLGIGLALARRLMELHGGTIGARSAGVGLGSAFTLQLPRAERCEGVA